MNIIYQENKVVLNEFPGFGQEIIIRVDRCFKPSYPNQVVRLIYPELESDGVEEYCLSDLKFLFHKDQKNNKWIDGRKIHRQLKDENMISSCLSLQDGLTIQKIGVENFRKVFSENSIFLFKSVVEYQNGTLRVPYLKAAQKSIALRWRSLTERPFGLLNPIICFPSTPLLTKS